MKPRFARFTISGRVAHKLAYRPSAAADLQDIYLWLREEAGAEAAFDYVWRLHTACRGLCNFPGRGSPRDDLAPGLRTIAFERRAVIAYLVQPGTVRIVRILRRGRDIGHAFNDD